MSYLPPYQARITTTRICFASPLLGNTGLVMLAQTSSAVRSGSTAARTANRALLVPICPAIPMTITELWIATTNTTGNIDLGIYDSALNRLNHTGNNTAVTAGLNVTLSTAYEAVPGVLIYLALVTDNAGTNFNRWTGMTTARMGCLEATSASPLPDPITTAVSSTAASIPEFGVSATGI